MSTPPAEKRCARADREATADLLAEHYAAGTLDDEEYQERLDTAMSAKFPSELRGLCTDLPDLPEPEPVSESLPKRRRAHEAFQEYTPYRVWKSPQWAVQNWMAMGVTVAACIIGGANGGLTWGVMVLLCCVVNGLVGLRKSWVLGLIGFLTGPFAFLGTALMIILTWRRSPSAGHDKANLADYPRFSADGMLRKGSERR